MQNYTTIAPLFTEYFIPPDSVRTISSKIMGFWLETLLLHSLSLPNRGFPPDLDGSATSAGDGFSESFLLSTTVHYHHHTQLAGVPFHLMLCLGERGKVSFSSSFFSLTIPSRARPQPVDHRSEKLISSCAYLSWRIRAASLRFIRGSKPPL